MRLGETVTLMVQGARALPQEVSRITQAINRFRPPDQQLDEAIVTAIELLAALEQLDPAIKEVVKNITLETVEDSAMPMGQNPGDHHLSSSTIGKHSNIVMAIIGFVLFAINAAVILYMKQDSETTHMILTLFVEIIKAFIGAGGNGDY